MLKLQVNESIIENSQPISHNLFKQLQKDILLGKLKPGNKLTEQEICDKYNVSRTPVRDAIKKLANEGLVDLIPNRGAFVRGFSKQDFSDMQELRKLYEIQAVEWAIERITESELADLEETFEFMEFYTKRGEVDKMLNINMAFHKLIYDASHNRLLSQVLTSYQIYSKYYNTNKQYNQTYLDSMLEEHRQIFKAFKSADKIAARKAMLEHMENSINRESELSIKGGKDEKNENCD